MDRLFPLVVAMEVYRFLDYESLALLVHASRSVQRAYEPVALLLVKGLVRAAAGRVGHMRVRLHRTSLVHNLWKLWRRSVALLEECLVPISMARGGILYFRDSQMPSLGSAWRLDPTRAPALTCSRPVRWSRSWTYSSSGASTCGRRIACTRSATDGQVSIWEQGPPRPGPAHTRRPTGIQWGRKRGGRLSDGLTVSEP